jgi:MraZ protein
MFMGTHQNRIDAKGRVSIPAPFRAVLRESDGRDTVKLVLRPSHNYACVEAWPEAEFRTLAAPLQSLSRFSEEYDDLAAALYADACPVESDKEGRIGVPADLAAHAGLKDMLMFVGMGANFWIWDPQEGAAFRAAQRERQKQHRLIAPSVAGNSVARSAP